MAALDQLGPESVVAVQLAVAHEGDVAGFVQHRLIALR